MNLVLSLLFIIFSLSAKAEYRAFRLHLENKKTKVTKQFLSTLDPEQYRTQFPTQADEEITYVETWRCWGRTDFYQPICKKPDKNPARQPSQSPESVLKK